MCILRNVRGVVCHKCYPMYRKKLSAQTGCSAYRKKLRAQKAEAPANESGNKRKAGTLIGIRWPQGERSGEYKRKINSRREEG